MGLRRIDTVALVVVDVVGGPSAEPHNEATTADIVDQRDLFGQSDRMVQRHLGDRETESDALRAPGQGRRERDRIDIGADAVEVMLRQPHHLHAELIAETRLGQRLLDDLLILLRVHRGRKQEVAEFHRSSFVRPLFYTTERAGKPAPT